MGEAIGDGFDKVLLYHDRESFRVNATNLINLERPPFGSLKNRTLSFKNNSF